MKNKYEIKRIVDALKDCSIKISIELKKINNNSIRYLKQNIHGEQVTSIDEISDKIISDKLQSIDIVAGYVSEEQNKPVVTNEKGKYIIMFDPLDGSSNIDLNITTGTIFSVLERKSTSLICSDDFLQIGENIKTAGYFLYGPSLELVIADRHAVSHLKYSLDTRSFVLTTDNLKGKSEGTYISFNASKLNEYPTRVKTYAEALMRNEYYSFRYVGSLVGDFHRNLLKGGIFLYPATEKHPNGKLRLMYECAPLAFIARAAKGSATDGYSWILDKKPVDVHERSPLTLGSENMVIDFLSHLLIYKSKVV
jgi:fructose-1,6-bisphosphatase I